MTLPQGWDSAGLAVSAVCGLGGLALITVA